MGSRTLACWVIRSLAYKTLSRLAVLILLLIIFREYSWKSYNCSQTGRKVIAIKDIITDQNDQLDYPDRVIQIALGFNHLVIATVKQCFIHKLTSWNTPVTFDLKEGTISMILLAEK